jgi:hypothetical protein
LPQPIKRPREPQSGDPNESAAVHEFTAPQFSLTCGGPAYQIYLRTGLARQPLELSKARLLAFVLLLWLPPFLLSIFAYPRAGAPQIPFLQDLEIQARLLVAVPLLLIQEQWAHRWLPGAVRQFVERGIIPPAQQSRFDSIVTQALRLQRSWWAEAAILILVLVVGQWYWRERLLFRIDSWYAFGGTLRAAGLWYVLFSVPVFQFILYRWYYRLVIWYRLLWQISRLPLVLNALHPDRGAGIGFLARTLRGFELLFATHSVLLAGAIANQIWHGGATLTHYRFEVGGIIVLMVVVAVFPLAFFTPKLITAEHHATHDYGLFATRYVQRFRERWLRSDQGEEMLGTGDIQSLSDLDNSFSTMRETNPVPFSRDAVMELLAFTSVPFLPLVLIVVPIDQLLDRLAKLLL